MRLIPKTSFSQPFTPTALALAAALTAALAAAPAQAQSGISISGLIDVGVYSGFDDIKRVGTIQRSNIAFSGVENLGGGLAATFMLSHRFDADTGLPEGQGSKPFWQGESTVGLKSPWGHLRLGRALDVIYALDWRYDPWGNFDRVASPAWYLWHFNYASSRTSNNGSAEYGRLSNGIFYDSPSMGGFTLHASGSFENDNAPGAGTGNNSGLSLNYQGGGVDLMLAASRNSSGDTVQFLGGRYASGAWAVMGAYDRSVFNAAVDSVSDVYSVGATYTVGMTTLKASYAHQDLEAGAGSQATDFLGLGASYALSKRTNVYVSVGLRDIESQPSAESYGLGVGHSF